LYLLVACSFFRFGLVFFRFSVFAGFFVLFGGGEGEPL
jgi:hypothetical protein